MSYFSNFPKLLYSTSLGIKNFKLVPNLIAKVTFIRNILQNSDLYYKYSIKDGEKPEDIAYKFYKDPTKHWIILLANQVVDPQYDWLLSTKSLENYINKKYSSYSLYLNLTETYVNDYIVGEVAYQGSTIDASNCDSIVESYDSTNKILKVRLASDIIANNSIIAGSQSNETHSIIGVKCDTDDSLLKYNGIEWSKTAISHYKITETKWNDYDDIKTKQTYRVSVKDFNNSTNEIINNRTESSTTSVLLSDGSTLYIKNDFSPVYYYDYEIEQNELKRNIIVPRPTYVSRIEEQFQKMMAE